MGMTTADDAALRRRIESTLMAVHQGYRVGIPRNAPCPCGSGRKFKRCCLPRGSNHGAMRALDDADRRRIAEEGLAKVRAEAIARGIPEDQVDAEIARMRGIFRRAAL